MLDCNMYMLLTPKSWLDHFFVAVFFCFEQDGLRDWETTHSLTTCELVLLKSFSRDKRVYKLKSCWNKCMFYLVEYYCLLPSHKVHLTYTKLSQIKFQLATYGGLLTSEMHNLQDLIKMTTFDPLLWRVTTLEGRCFWIYNCSWSLEIKNEA